MRPGGRRGVVAPVAIIDPSKFPTAKFEAAKFTHGQGNSYVANGTLSLHGMTKAVTLPFTLTITGNTAHMVGKAVVARPVVPEPPVAGPRVPPPHRP